MTAGALRARSVATEHSTLHKSRFLNMTAEQKLRRRKRQNQRDRRERLAKLRAQQGNDQSRPATTTSKNRKRKRTATEHLAPRKKLPCCGLRRGRCTCKAPPGMRKKPLGQLATYFSRTPLSTMQDTTDVSAFQDVMRDRCKELPTKIVLAYAYCFLFK